MRALEELEASLPPICTPKQIADMWCRSPEYIRELCNKGGLTHIKIGGRYEILRDDFLRFLEAKRKCPDEKQAQSSNTGKTKKHITYTITQEDVESSVALALDALN